MIHIYPIDDWIEHDTESTDCLCEPEVVYADEEGPLDDILVIHNAVDGRRGPFE